MKIFILSFLSLFLVSNASAKDNDKEKVISGLKANFILNVAEKVYIPSAQSDQPYRVGIYGKGNDIEAVQDQLLKLSKIKKIKNRKIEVYHFKRMRQVESVELLYVEGDSKIRISDLNEKLADNPYLIVTENFPFGSSLLNFTVHEEDLFFEVHPEALKTKGIIVAKSLLDDKRRVSSEDVWLKILKSAKQLIDEQNATIAEQSEQLSKQDRKISFQQAAIMFGTIFLFAIAVLSFYLYRTNKARKLAMLNLEKKNQDILASITYAKRIQDAILPDLNKFKDNLNNCFILFKPKDIVSGDFYWMRNIDNKVYFAIGDCTGHGVPGAIVSVMCSNTLTKVVQELNILEPSLILDKTSELLESMLSNGNENITDGMDIAICCLDTSTMLLKYAGANIPLYLLRNNTFEVIKPDRQAIGKISNRIPYHNRELHLQAEDSIFIHTDGYIDQFGGPQNKKLKRKKFREFLKGNHQLSQDQQQQKLDVFFEEWRGQNEQIDDVTVLGFRI
jgi:serine phosphatase RsbU (regulator of sigma subunit)